MVLFIVWHNVSLARQAGRGTGAKNVGPGSASRTRSRSSGCRSSQQEGQKLFDSARVAVAASDWSQARLDLEKALTTIGGEAAVRRAAREPAQALLKQVEQELRVEADRRASQARFQQFVKIRDEAQFLGTLYTGMDLAANLEAARTSVQQALAVYGVLRDSEARPAARCLPERVPEGRDPGRLLSAPADSCRDRSPVRRPTRSRPRRSQYLRQALGYLEQARRLRHAFAGVSPAAGTLPEHARRAGGSGPGREGGRKALPSTTFSITS